MIDRTHIDDDSVRSVEPMTVNMDKRRYVGAEHQCSQSIHPFNDTDLVTSVFPFPCSLLSEFNQSKPVNHYFVAPMSIQSGSGLAWSPFKPIAVGACLRLVVVDVVLVVQVDHIIDGLLVWRVPKHTHKFPS